MIFKRLHILTIGWVFIFGINHVTAQLDTILLCQPGDLAFLEARTGQFAYQWSPRDNLTNSTVYNPVARPRATALYIAKMIPALVGENLIENADFNEGNEGFTSDYPYVESISTQGVYGINESAKNLNGGFFRDCPDHTTGDGLMMVVDGSPITNQRVWCQTIEVEAQTGYAFSAWLTSVNPRNPAQLQFSINGRRLGDVFTAAAEVCEWRQFFATWESETTTTAEICIVNRNTNPQGNDFALDDFAFYEIEDIIYDSTLVMISELAIDTIQIERPDCGAENGILNVLTMNELGQVSYSLNGQTAQPTNQLENIGVGEYEIVVTDVFETQKVTFSCATETTITVNQKNCPIYVPNAFSPNDDQENDFFYLQSDPEFRGQLKSIAIYDRWGNQLLAEENISLADFRWDGTVNNSALEKGIYIYHILVEYEDGSIEQLMGEVNLIK
ncbi:MAG: gliding motility-associated C-terminal domain-containing protein [Bacteroidota bacterium]